MNEKQFDWLDDQFREAADQHEPPFNEASWQKLESKLDNSKPKRRAAWWWITDALILGVLVFMAWQIIPSKQAGLATADNKNNAVAETRVNKTETATTSSNTEEVGDNDLSQAALPQATNDPLTLQDEANQRTKANRSTGSYPNTQSGKNDQQALVTHDAKANDKDLEATNNRLTKDDNDEDLLQSGQLVIDDKASWLAADQQVQPTQPEPEVASSTTDNAVIATAAAENAAPPSVADKKTSSTKNGAKGFYMFGMAGSEWSLVAGSEAGKATFAWGLGMGYRISPKWAVQAGYFKTQKVYTAGPGDYQAKPGTYYYNLTIKQVEADCHITEIPVSLSYTLFDKKKQSLFATVGLSSYIMKSEEYHYDYIRANSTPGYAKYQYETNNSHLFAGLMLSGGYSFKLFDGLSLSAEPYLKVPLYGVGEGSIKIYSFGLMAGARYSLPSLRRK